MASQYAKYLQEWGLAEYIDIFEEEGIDDTIFELLDNETIEKIFKKCGPRIKFKNKYQEYLQKTKLHSSSDAPSDFSYDTDTVFSFPSTSSCTPDQQVNKNLDKNIVLLEPDEETREILASIQNIDNTYKKRQSQPENEIIPECKKQKIDSIFPLGLESLLSRSPEGKIILLNRNKLKNDHRQKLVKIIISELLTTIGTELRASTFLRVSEEIETIFPNEKSFTYYIPYIPRGKGAKGSGPKGKLWSRYANVKAALRQANTFKVLPNTNFDKRNSPEKTEVQETQLEFLKVAVEPYPKILECWESTNRLRRKKYINKELSEIYKDFPCLKLNTGIDLVNIYYFYISAC